MAWSAQERLMTGYVILDLFGGVALLLWGLHMLRSGVVRAFGPELRRFLGWALRNRFTAFLTGVGVTAVLQSSTATALMATSFARKGLVALMPALALMLGANVGTALVVQFLSFNVSIAAPILLVVGVGAFHHRGHTRIRDLGRAAIGLGLMLLALHTLLDTLAPAENAPQLGAILAAATAAPLLDLIIGATLAWAAHSSVAVIILAMSLAYSSFVTPVGTLALVLGANLGSAINPLLEGAHADPRAAACPSAIWRRASSAASSPSRSYSPSPPRSATSSRTRRGSRRIFISSSTSRSRRSSSSFWTRRRKS
jgi:phosphate:Na+ symporter